MDIKIAIVTTEFLRKFVESVFAEFQMDITFKIFIYRTYRDVPEVFRSIPDEYEGVITSGIFPATIIQKSCPDTKKVIHYFNSDDAGICRLFLQRLVEGRAFDLSRVYGDFVEIFGISLQDYLMNAPKYSYTDLIDPIASAMSLEEIFSLEKVEIEKHKLLFKSGQIDFSVSRFSSIVEELRAEGVPVFFPYPSLEYLRSVVEKLQSDIAILRLLENCPAAINVSIIQATGSSMQGASFQEQHMVLRQALVKFNGDSMLDYILQQTPFGYEILTNRRTLSKYTGEFTQCRLREFLEQRLSFPVCIGYGIGADIYQARIHAMNAGRENGLNGAGSYLINEKEELIGPLGKPGNLTVPIHAFSSLNELAKRSGLSPLTLSRVAAVAASMPDQRLTAGDLAMKLSITTRSANRFLSALLKINGVEVVGERRSTTKGRPERIFKVLLDL